MGHIAYTSLVVLSREDWYFNRSFSRHMTRERNNLKDIKLYSNNYANIGDDVKGKNSGK